MPFPDVLSEARRIFSQEQIAQSLNVHVRTVRRWEKGTSPVPQMAFSALSDLLKRGTATRLQEPSAPYIVKRSAFQFIDLFAGIGGTRLGFEAAGGQCVFTSEWDKFSCQTYRANHSDLHTIAGDITKVDAADIPDHDVLVAGFPCQPFSLAGVSKKNSLGRDHGFLDKTQGTLFFDVARILAEKRPAAFLLENVKNLKSHDGGKTYKIILRTLRDELGYSVVDNIIDAAGFVPQHRERIFIVGFLEPSGFDWRGLDLPNPGDGPTLQTILHSEREIPETPFTETTQGKTKVSAKYTLSDHLWNYLQEYAEKHRIKGNGFGCSVFGPHDRARTLSARYHKDGSEILISQGKKNPRRLTPRECARLMGFPDSFQIPVSDTQAYRQFGNSVVVPVIEAIAVGIAAALRGTPLVGANDVLQPSLPGFDEPGSSMGSRRAV